MSEDKESCLTTDKLFESFSLRIPTITKEHLEKMPKKFKKKLNEEIMLVMARVIHESRFDPSDYLSTKED